MPVLRDVGRIISVTARGTRAVAKGVRSTTNGTVRAGRFVRRNVGFARTRSGVGNVGLMRLLDLHAISCAGDTLVTIGLAGTIFFNVPAGEARGRVALYLLVTMVPFALLAPLVGPLLDRFRHGRRYALAATMLGRAFLAWVIADNIAGFGLYPAAFGVLALSRAYGVARSAAVPRLLPRGLGLSQVGARASVYGTGAGAIVAPIGALAFTIGPQWPLRVASLIFLAGVIVAFNLPPRADSDPPEVVPKIFQIPWRHREENGHKILSGRLVVATLIGSACLRALYGFLFLYLAFAIREHDLSSGLGAAGALGLVGVTLAFGTFLATAIGTGLRIRTPTVVQAAGLSTVAIFALWAALRFTLTSVVVLCLATAIASGLAKLAVDAVIQERVPETVRASAFAHAETLLMLAWVAGGAIGLVPFGGQFGLVVAAIATLAAAVRAVLVAWRLRGERLVGRASVAGSPPPPPRSISSNVYGQPAATVVAPPRVDPPAAGPAAGAARSEPAPAVTVTDEQSPPGFHIFRPSPPDSGVADPRSGP